MAWAQAEGETPDEKGRSTWHLDMNFAGFYSFNGEDLPGTEFSHVQPTDRVPRNYVGFEFTHIPTEKTWLGRRWVSSIVLNPRLEADFYARQLQPFVTREMFFKGWSPTFRPLETPAPLSFDFFYGENIDYGDNRRNMIRLKLVFHDLWIRFDPPSLPRTYIRVGHFDIPYGQTVMLDTRRADFIVPPEVMDVWLKKDWGVSWKGPLGEYDYELALTTGQGLGLNDPNWFSDQYPASYVASGRVGAPTYWRFNYGLSAFWGRTPMMMGDHRVDPYAPMRWRLNVDTFFRLSDHTAFLAELGGGQNEKHIVDSIFQGADGSQSDVLTGQMIVDHVPRWFSHLNLKAQFKMILYDIGYEPWNFFSLAVQADYSLTSAINLRLAYENIVKSPKFVGPEDQRIYFSFNYYR